MEILVGCSGYSYRGWRGRFYPKDLPGYRFIEYYEQHFPAVELNFTFYKLEKARDTIKSILKRTEKLVLSVKLHRDFTHRRNYGEETLEKFERAIEPAHSAGRLGAILAQFPGTFEKSRENIDYIKRLRRDLKELPLAIEFRSGTWLDEEVLLELSNLKNVSIASVDAPDIEGLFRGPWRTYGDFNYIRLHGRNKEGWNDYRTRYDYDYSGEELEEIAVKIQKMKKLKTFVFFNNTPHAHAPLNALTLMEILGIR